MDWYRKNIDPENELSYKLVKGAHLAEKESTLYLIRENPLSTIIINLAWKPVLELLTRGEYIRFKEIYTLVDADPDKAEIYLNSLVRKGFMECLGYKELEEYPSVTVIIPVRNRPNEISDCLNSISQLDYPSDKLETLVIDDGSNDNTPEIVSSFPVKLIKNSGRMQASYSRNIAAKEARGDILAFIDSDCTADPLWLKALVPGFIDQTNGAVGGKVDSWFDINALDRYEKVSSSLYMGNLSRSSREEGNFFYLPTCNLLVKKDIFLKLGGFNIDMTVGEDVDFCWRLKDNGHEIEYRPSGVVFHKHRNKIGAFFSRRFQYGTSEPLLQKKHPDRVKKMFYMPLTAIMWLIVLTGFLTGHYLLFLFCGIALAVDTHTKWKQVMEKELPVRYSQVLSAVFRGYFVSLYYWCAFFSRYYLAMAFLLIPIFPLPGLVLFINHLFISTCDYFIKKPHSGFFTYVYLFTIDQLAYQTGAWYGCLKYHSFNPVNPVISRWRS